MSNGDGSAAVAYHERTKHSVTSVRSSRHFLDWEIQPLPFKVYENLEALPVARTLAPLEMPALDAVSAFGVANDAGAAPDIELLSQILHYSAGITKRVRSPAGERYFRAAACTGALYHIDLYVVAADLPGLEAGVYHYGPHDGALRRLRAGDHRSVLVEASGEEPAVAAAPVILVCTSTYWRNAWKYQARAYRHCFWDGGTLVAHLLAVAAARAQPARVVAGFVDASVARLLGLDSRREVAVALVPLGRADGAAPPAPESPPLALATVPLSSRDVEYPTIGEIHEATSLGSGTQVRAWRGVGPSSPMALPPEPTHPTVALEPLPAGERSTDALDRVIRRRSSTRTFARRALSRNVVSTLLEAATRGIPADFLDPPGTTLNDLYLIVNAVDGIEPGAYLFQRAHGALELLRAGDFRREAAFLGLGQDLPGDASVDVFCLASLGSILERYGDRGYRAAQLEGGIIGGKLYLAAYAQRVGATGLTFFDDDVIDFFSPHAAGKSVMFLTALGVPARRSL